MKNFESKHLVSLTAILAITAVLVVLIISGQIEPVKDPIETSTSPEEPVVADEPAEELDEMKDGFMSGCVQSPGWYDYCECAYDFLLERHGMTGIMEIGTEYQKTDTLPPEMEEAVYECISHID